MRRRVGERIDAVEGPIRVRLDRFLQGLGYRWVGSLLEKAPEWLRVSHFASSNRPQRPISIRPLPFRRRPAQESTTCGVSKIYERPDALSPPPRKFHRLSASTSVTTRHISNKGSRKAETDRGKKTLSATPQRRSGPRPAPFQPSRRVEGIQNPSDGNQNQSEQNQSPAERNPPGGTKSKSRFLP